MAEIATSLPATARRTRWRWFLALGVALLLLGLAGAGATTFLQLTSVILFGPMLLASSFSQVFTAYFTEQGRESVLHFVAAGLEALLGFIIMAHPLQDEVSLIALIAVFLMVGGLLRLARALVTHGHGRAWVVMTGVMALLLGLSLWLGWPFAELWFVGLCIALDFVCHGASWSVRAWAESKHLQSPAS
jgi:uncharacterized membrane protein HdeD (DUF308 family)